MLARIFPHADFYHVHVTSLSTPVLFDFEVQVVHGDVTDQLLRFAARKKVDLVLLGHRRSRSARRSLARRLAMTAPCSVWMVPNGSAAKLERILIPIDFSDKAADALRVGSAIASLAGLEQAVALHVFFNQASVTYDEYDDILRENEAEAFRIFAARIDLHGVDVIPLFEEGPNVAHTVNRIAVEGKADLVVMGTRGRSRSAAILLGSETDHTIMETKIPILAVKHFGARLRLLQVLLDPRMRERGSPRFN